MNLKTKAVVTVIVATVIAISGFCAWWFQPSYSRQTFKEDFENGFGEWVVDAEVPFDPNKPGNYVEWNITRSTDVASSGQYSLKLFIDGRQDDGTIWIERKIPIKKGIRIRVSMSFDFYSEYESQANTIAVICAYVGLRNPTSEEHFTVIGNANEVEGWKRYDYTIDIDTSSNEAIWVALGISVRWETYMTYYIDNIEVTIL